MSESKHTEGKWKVMDKDNNEFMANDSTLPEIAISSTYKDKDNRHVFCPIAEIFIIGGGDRRKPEALANANLIAAAPETKARRDELLEACKMAIQSGPMKINPTPTSKELENGIEGLPETTMLDFRVSVKTYKEIKSAITKAETMWTLKIRDGVQIVWK